MSIDVMKQALKALEKSQAYVWAASNAKFCNGWGEQLDIADAAITALRAAIEQEQRHNGWALREVLFDEGNPIGHREPQHKPLTDEEIEKCYETTGHYQELRPQDRFAVFALARAIEAAHGIGEKK